MESTTSAYHNPSGMARNLTNQLLGLCIASTCIIAVAETTPSLQCVAAPTLAFETMRKPCQDYEIRFPDTDSIIHADEDKLGLDGDRT